MFMLKINSKKYIIKEMKEGEAFMEVIILLTLIVLFLILSLPKNKTNQPRSTTLEPSRQTCDPKEEAGIRGEKMLLQAVKFTSCGGHILCNLKVPTNYNVTEIDLVLLHQTGIYVFEAKNYAGSIYGRQQDEYWSQIKHQEEKEFYNPMKQNETHIRALSYYLHIPEQIFCSYIVFGNQAILKEIERTNEDHYILNLKALPQCLHEEVSMYDAIYTQQELEKFYELLRRLEHTYEE